MTTTAISPLSTPQAAATLDSRFGLALATDERVLVVGQPQRGRLMSYLMVATALICAMSVIGLVLLPLLYFVNRAWVDKHRYWVTSSRVVVTTGIIGFRARSIPLERVSDVAISCSWLERAFGLRSVVVRDMTGEAMSGARMMAIPDATGMQQQILDLVHEVNRTAPSRDGQQMGGHSYRQIEQDRERADVLEVLRRIEANTRSAAL